MGPGGEPGLDIFWVQQAGAPRPQGNAFVHRSTVLAHFRLLPTHAQQRT